MIKDIKNFYEKTKFTIGETMEFINDFQPPINWIKIFFKTYPRMDKVKLKSQKDKNEFCQLLEQRISTRNFEDCPISFDSLNRILFYSMGIKSPNESFEHTRRFYPSAGARYPIESYLVSNNVQGLSKGLYHYNIKSNQLEQLLNKDLVYLILS